MKVGESKVRSDLDVQDDLEILGLRLRGIGWLLQTSEPGRIGEMDDREWASIGSIINEYGATIVGLCNELFEVGKREHEKICADSNCPRCLANKREF